MLATRPATWRRMNSKMECEEWKMKCEEWKASTSSLRPHTLVPEMKCEERKAG
jgi:hypothetical protein